MALWTHYGSEPADDIVAIDFESYFDDEISLRKMSAWEYTNHPAADPYLISVVGADFEWVGHPKDFSEWDRLTGKVVVAHNMAFDILFFRKLQKNGTIPESCRPLRFACTADCTSYLRSKRSLQSAVKNFFGVDISKQVREDAKGKTYDELRASDSWQAMLAYGLDDSRWCRRIAVEKFPLWPACEQRLSELNREAASAGIHVDREALEAGIAKLEEALFEYGKAIPWYPDEPALSTKAVRAQGRKDGILVPASLAKSDEEGEAFYREYGDRFPWVKAIRDYRSTNILLAKLKTMAANLRPDGTMPYTSTYFGAHSGRLTAGVKKESAADDVGGSFNLYNLPKFEMQGVNLRHLLVPPPGRKFMILDYAQVEARIVLWVAGDEATLERIRSGYNVYEAAAVNVLGREDTKGLKKKEPKTYAFVKATVLGANYNMGGPRFRETAPLLTGGEYRPDAAEAAEAIAKYRAANPKIVAQWHYHQAMLMSSASNRDATHVVRLPSGRKIAYFNPEYALVVDDAGNGQRRELLAAQVLGDAPRRIYGGKVFENCLAAGTRVLTDSGWKPIELVGHSDLVHDGIDFVQHGGAILKDVSPCVSIDGVWMTPDHKVLTDEGWQTARENPRPYRPDLRGADCAEHVVLSAVGGHPGGSRLPDSRQSGEPAVFQTYDLINCGPRSRFVVLGDSGPFIVHNCAQSIARDVLRDGWIAMTDAGYEVNWTVYDEFVVPVPDDGCGNSGCRWCHPENFGKDGSYRGTAPEVPMSESCGFDLAARDLRRLATQSSPWAAGLPLDSDVELASHYQK